MDPRPIQTNALTNSITPPRNYVRILRAAAWNVAFTIAGLLLIAVVGEIYLRLANPFLETRIPSRFVDGVGLIREPNTEMRYANWHDDQYVVSHTNSQGFVDREPVSSDRAAAGCHIAFIGDSYLEAIQTPIANKFHVRLEDMAARELPRLAIATQAYGILGTGQISQLPFYDEYARHLNPKLLVLVFYINDFADNSPALYSLVYGMDPDRLPYMSVQRGESGALKLRPPDPKYARFLLPMQLTWRSKAWNRLIGVSYFAKYLDTKKGWVSDRVNSISAEMSAPVEPDPEFEALADMIAARPCCASLRDDRPLPRRSSIIAGIPFREEYLSHPAFSEALAYTAFGIDQFKQRADRDGVNLLIMAATRDMGTPGDPQFDRLSAIAKARGIPVISHYDYIVSQGHDENDGRWSVDRHWNVTGHQWAAEAVLEWLKANQDVCE